MKNPINKIKMIVPAMAVTLMSFVFTGCEKSELTPAITGDYGIQAEQKFISIPDVPGEIACLQVIKLSGIATLQAFRSTRLLKALLFPVNMCGHSWRLQQRST
jgi:hypothetical protein